MIINPFSMHYFLIFLLGFPLFATAQYEGIYTIPMPEKFSTMKKGIVIYSSPNPNYAEFENSEQKSVVWKHRTVIKVPTDMTIKETGAYLLFNGTWRKRASFNAKKTKEMFDTKDLKLQATDSIVFEKNWRYGNYTQTGWNFWYVIGVTASGEQWYGYDILETKGRFKDETQVLPLTKSGSQLTWLGKAGDSDYTLTGSITDFYGRIVVQEGLLRACSIQLNMDSIQHEIPSLVKHLKNKDFFDVKKHPKATFESTEVKQITTTNYQIKGTFCLRGVCREEVFDVTLASSSKAYEATFDATIDRTQYGMLFASSKEKNAKQSIADTFQISATFSFMKDYPGSTPWSRIK